MPYCSHILYQSRVYLQEDQFLNVLPLHLAQLAAQCSNFGLRLEFATSQNFIKRLSGVFESKRRGLCEWNFIQFSRSLFSAAYLMTLGTRRSCPEGKDFCRLCLLLAVLDASIPPPISMTFRQTKCRKLGHQLADLALVRFLLLLSLLLLDKTRAPLESNLHRHKISIIVLVCTKNAHKRPQSKIYLLRV